MGSFTFRSRWLPLYQAVFTGGSTAIGIGLVVLWRPDRSRRFPFYSDATHNDPERVILACGENIACFLMPLVAVAEYLYLDRLSRSGRYASRPVAPRYLRILVRPWMTTAYLIRFNFFCTMLTTVFFFVTANVPSKRPFTPPHQLAASGLILMYLIQSMMKAVLAQTFGNYRSPASSAASNPASDKASSIHLSSSGPTTPESSRFSGRWWEEYHMAVRLGIVGALWVSLIGTWLSYAGRKIASALELANAASIRSTLATAMALVVYMATTSCVLLMVIMSVDMRSDALVIGSTDAWDDAFTNERGHQEVLERL